MAVEGRVIPIADPSVRSKGGSEVRDGLASEAEGNTNDYDVNINGATSRDPAEGVIQSIVVHLPEVKPQASETDPQVNTYHDQGETNKLEKEDFSDSDSERGDRESDRVNGSDFELLGRDLTFPLMGDITKAQSSDAASETIAEYILTARNRKRLIRSSVSNDAGELEEGVSVVPTISYENAKYVQVDLIDSKSVRTIHKLPTAEKTIQVRHLQIEINFLNDFTD